MYMTDKRVDDLVSHPQFTSQRVRKIVQVAK